jgi:chromosome partitioning protein
VIQKTCGACGKAFDVMFAYQIQKHETATNYYCSIACREPAIKLETTKECSSCGKTTTIMKVNQIRTHSRITYYYCNNICRENHINIQEKSDEESKPLMQRRIAVINQKGGTGKTTTAINLAAGLTEIGKKVLIIDMDPQGNVGTSLGVTWQKSIYHVFVENISPKDAIIPIRKNLDCIVSNESLAQAEIFILENHKENSRFFEMKMEPVNEYDYIIVDLAPSFSLINQNALLYVNEVVIAVSCDYLSLVGVQQIFKTISRLKRQFNKDLNILGVLPTFFDVRNKISFEAVNSLEKHFKDKLLTPIRINTKLKEAPMYKKTIFEHAPESHGSVDYKRLVEFVDNHR